MLLFDRLRASTTISRAPRGTSANPRLVALTPASVRSVARAAISTRNRAMRFMACFARNARVMSVPWHVAGHAVARAERKQLWTPASETTVPVSRRHDGTRPRPAPSTRRNTLSSRIERSSPRATVPRAFRTQRCSTSAASAGIRRRGRRPARPSGARAAFIRSRRIAISPPPARAAFNAGGGRGRVRRALLGLVEAAIRSRRRPRGSAHAR
jgi:hypothetical protein